MKVCWWQAKQSFVGVDVGGFQTPPRVRLVGQRGVHRAVVPLDPQTNVVGEGLGRRRTHVACGASWSRGVVLANHPLGGVQFHIVDVCSEGDAVLALFVDLFLGMVRPEMTLSTVVRMTSLLGREVVALVTGRAGAFGAIRVDPANSGIGPGRWIQLAGVRVDLHHTAMALPTTIHRRG